MQFCVKYLFSTFTLQFQCLRGVSHTEVFSSGSQLCLCKCISSFFLFFFILTYENTDFHFLKIKSSSVIGISIYHEFPWFLGVVLTTQNSYFPSVTAKPDIHSI